MSASRPFRACAAMPLRAALRMKGGIATSIKRVTLLLTLNRLAHHRCLFGSAPQTAGFQKFAPPCDGHLSNAFASFFAATVALFLLYLNPLFIGKALSRRHRTTSPGPRKVESARLAAMPSAYQVLCSSEPARRFWPDPRCTSRNRLGRYL